MFRPGAADRLQVIEHFLHEQLANVVAEFQPQVRVLFAASTGRATSATICSQVGTRCRPPMPLRFGSTNLSESFHIGLVKSTMASSRPKIGLFSRWLGPQHFHSHSSSPGVKAKRLAGGEVLQVHIRQPFEGVVDRLRHVMDVRELIGHRGERARQNVNGVEPAVAQVNQMAAGGLLADAIGEAGDVGRRNSVKRPADAAGEAQAAQTQFFGGRQHGNPSSSCHAQRMVTKDHQLVRWQS